MGAVDTYGWPGMVYGCRGDEPASLCAFADCKRLRASTALALTSSAEDWIISIRASAIQSEYHQLGGGKRGGGGGGGADAGKNKQRGRYIKYLTTHEIPYTLYYVIYICDGKQSPSSGFQSLVYTRSTPSGPTSRVRGAHLSPLTLTFTPRYPGGGMRPPWATMVWSVSTNAFRVASSYLVPPPHKCLVSGLLSR